MKTDNYVEHFRGTYEPTSILLVLYFMSSTTPLVESRRNCMLSIRQSESTFLNPKLTLHELGWGIGASGNVIHGARIGEAQEIAEHLLLGTDSEVMSRDKVGNGFAKLL